MPGLVKKKNRVGTCLMWLINLCMMAYSVKSIEPFLSSSNTWISLAAAWSPIGRPSKVTGRLHSNTKKRTMLQFSDFYAS